MKRSLINKVVLLMVQVIFSCTILGCNTSVPKEEITVFAAASLTETLSEIKDDYMEEHPDVAIIFNFDSSGTLKTQIEEGAVCDMFISASTKQIDELDITQNDEKNPKRLDYIDPDLRIDLLENKVVLAVNDDNAGTISSFEDMKDKLLTGEITLAVGNEDVPVGQYTKKLFDYLDLNESELLSAGVITYGSNVKEVCTQVFEGMADCGIIYSTDAVSAELNSVCEATEEMCGRVIYPVAILKNSLHSDEVRDFMEYLTSEDARVIFEGVGFRVLK